MPSFALHLVYSPAPMTCHARHIGRWAPFKHSQRPSMPSTVRQYNIRLSGAHSRRLTHFTSRHDHITRNESRIQGIFDRCMGSITVAVSWRVVDAQEGA